MKDKQNNPDLLISVESRKGGVGKTTAALCLARLLLKKGYSVLLLDLDVTGTNAADIAGSPFWRDDLHIIRYESQGDMNSASPLPAINFVTLFDEYFMAGKAVPTFSIQTVSDHMFIDLAKVNVFGSQIYKTGPGKDKKKKGQHGSRIGNETTCITHPGILFDDLHTLWLLDFVKQLSETFTRVVGSATSGSVAVILDNSPGYVGIAPAIHEWLTDCGPQRGKFLTVTSLDVQDLLACEQAIATIHTLYTGKWETSRLFIEAGNFGADITVEKTQETFFMRLATASHKSDSIEDDPLAFYRVPVPIFSATEINRPDLLATKLIKGDDPLSAFLWSQFDSAGQQALGGISSNSLNISIIQRVICQNLNKIIQGPSIYDEQRFSGVSLRKETCKLANEKPDGVERSRLNRQLLEDAYPAELSVGHKAIGQSVCTDPTGYIAAVINRVPRAVKTGWLSYETPPELNRESSVLCRILEGRDSKQDWRHRMISYDEYIENQFLFQLQRGRGRSERRLHHLIRIFEMAADELRVGTRQSENDPIESLAMDCEHYEKLNARLTRANDILNRARNAIENAGLAHLARLIHEEWLPGSILPAFRNALFKLLRESDLPHFDVMPLEFDIEVPNSEGRELAKDLREAILMELRHSHEREITEKGRMTSKVLAGVLAGIAGLSLASPLWHSPFRKEISGIFGAVLTIELEHWSKRSDDRSSRCSVQRFLAQESIKRSEIDMEFLMHNRFFRHAKMAESGDGFADFYKACTSAQARLIDFAGDSLFLLNLLRCIIKGETETGALFPFIRGIAEDVIINKSVRHEEASAKMAKALQTAEYFCDFDGVLIEVLKDWGIDA